MDILITYQDKVQNIISQLKNIIFPQHIQMCYEYEPILYLKVFTDMNKSVTDCSYSFKNLIMTKTKEQLERIKKCVEINEKTYEFIYKNFKKGMNELDTYKLVKESNYHNSGENIPFVCDIVAGKRSCDVSGFPTEYIPKTGDTMILDLLPRYQGVYCDHTRTFFIGKPTEKQKKIYGLLLEALKRVENILKPGTVSKDIYEAIYETFKEASLHECFPHHGGHGIGLTIYEPPYFIKEDDKVLQYGMIVAIEPGIYIKEEFGIRIENNYFITEDGFELLGNIPTEIDEYTIKI